ncbi:MAG: methyltransferase [Pseudomonadota bacterium]
MSRLEHALARSALELPETGGLLAVAMPAEFGVTGLLDSRIKAVQGFRPTFDKLRAQGFDVVPTLDDAGSGFSTAHISAVRSRAATAYFIGQSARSVRPGGLILVDGAKTDGIEAHYRAVRERVEVEGNITKAHGRLFWFRAGGEFEDWAQLDMSWPKVGRFRTAPGVFSADAIDPASAALAEALPLEMAGAGADLGAGWGFLAAALLKRPGVTWVDLVEADHAALDAARSNVEDKRARFHWADVRQWRPDAPLDWVVMNPPFHEGRAADPTLGQAFIEAAARALAGHGSLWLVANRHLPYETTLAERFRKWAEYKAPAGFKIIKADQPRKRAGRS